MTLSARSSSPWSVRESAGRVPVRSTARRAFLNTSSVLPAVGFYGSDVAVEFVRGRIAVLLRTLEVEFELQGRASLHGSNHEAFCAQPVGSFALPLGFFTQGGSRV